MADPDPKKDPKVWLIGGALLLAVGIGAIVILDDSAGCKVTASGVAVIANGLTHGRPTTQIVVDATAGLAASEVCEAIVDKLRNEPEAPVGLDVETSQGTGEVSVTGSQLTQPPPARTTCDDWLTSEYQQACVDRQITPPVIDLNPGQPTCHDWLLLSFVEACLQGTIGPPSQET